MADQKNMTTASTYAGSAQPCPGAVPSGVIYRAKAVVEPRPNPWRPGTGRRPGPGYRALAPVDAYAEQVQAALARPLASIVDAVKDVLERTPPELASDVAERGKV
jgi:hypothetical protein